MVGTPRGRTVVLIRQILCAACCIIISIIIMATKLYLLFRSIFEMVGACPRGRPVVLFRQILLAATMFNGKTNGRPQGTAPTSQRYHNVITVYPNVLQIF